MTVCRKRSYETRGHLRAWKEDAEKNTLGRIYKIKMEKSRSGEGERRVGIDGEERKRKKKKRRNNMFAR